LTQIDKILKEHTEFAKKLQEANENVEKILETLPVGIVIMDMNDQIQKLNSSALELLDARAPEDVIGKKASTIFTSSAKSENEAELKTFRGKKLLVMKSSITLKIRNEFVTIEAFMDITETRRSREELERLVEERTKEITHTNKKLQDEINERKQVQIQLLQSEKMSALGQLAAAIAHEINNPIGFINANLSSAENYLEKLINYIDQLEHINPEKQDLIKQYQNKYKIDFIKNDFKDLIKESEDGTERVKKIVGELKKFIYKEDKEHITQININKEIDSTLNIVWNELRYKAEIIKEFDPDLPEIPCFTQQLNQVLMNILLNAGQAIKTKGTIKIKTYKQDKNIIIEISDTGQGIPEENLATIFNPFFTTKERGQGTGLGLSIANDIIKRHHGKIEVQSKLEKGSNFKIILPIQTSDHLKESR
ncbi:GHKL domain-containing protein, partial [bacterium]|nr:GHKL domain-containing protein [bacterium]